MSLALLCPGQGAQHPNMLKIATHNDAAAEVLRTVTTALAWRT